jgi:hypothetical protein
MEPTVERKNNMGDEIRLNHPEYHSRHDSVAEGLTKSNLASVDSRPQSDRDLEAPLHSETLSATKHQQLAAETEEAVPLLSTADSSDFRVRWDNIQVRFVDEPRQSVEQAHNLVAETMKRLADSFARERDNLEQQWDRGGDVSTEDLRQALRRYRSFFGRLVRV